MSDLESIMRRYNAWLTGVVAILAAVTVMGHLIKWSIQ